MQLLLIIQEIITTPALLVGLIVLIGLVLQKKPADHVIKGTVATIIGFILLNQGSEFLQDGPLADFSALFNGDFHLEGVVPNMEAVAAVSMASYAYQVSMIMFFGMLANLILAKWSLLPYIFLTGHHTLYMASLLTVVLNLTGMAQWKVILSGSLFLGFMMVTMPAIIQCEMNRVTGTDRIALGHFSSIGYLLAARVAKWVSRPGKTETAEDEASGKTNEKKKDTKKDTRKIEDFRFPKALAFMRDSNVGIFLAMTCLFLILSGIAASHGDLSRMNTSYASGSYRSFIIYSLIQGAMFAAAIYIILAGVRLIVAEIVPAFKGIAKKMVPSAKPAVDCPILFSYAPNAAMIGFLMSFLGGIVMMGLMMLLNYVEGYQLIPVIIPGVVAHFFCGGTAGVFANSEGGVKGCLIGSFVHGIFISLLPLCVMPLLGALNMSGTTFSDSDFCVAGVVVGMLSRILPENGMILVSLLLFLSPIAWRFLRPKKREIAN